MNREQERAKRRLEKNPVVECNKIQNKFYLSKRKMLAVWLRISPFYDMLLHTGNYSEPISKMLRISEVWRIRQIKFQKQSKKLQAFYTFFEILLGSEQLHTL